MSDISVYDISFSVEDEEGNSKLYTTKMDYDHSFIASLVDLGDLEPIESWVARRMLMIDIDKYEGHTSNGWYVDDAPDVIHPTVIHSNESDNIIAELVMANAEEWTEEDYANARLIADAPLLLAEVKRLKHRLRGTFSPSLVKRLHERIKDLEYEVENWKGELSVRMHPIDYDALVNDVVLPRGGGEE